MLPRAPHFPEVLRPDALSRVALGGPLTTETVLEAYRRGIFPWSGDDPVPWCATDPRLVLLPTQFRESRSLAKLARQKKHRVTFDRDFVGVMRRCATIERPGQLGTWITPRMIAVYAELHARGIAHSIETYRDGRLVGGLYGLSLGKGFFGESMFADEPNASKLALRALCRTLASRDFLFVDCQQVTPHLMRLGARPVRLRTFLVWLERALAMPAAEGSWRGWSDVADS